MLEMLNLLLLAVSRGLAILRVHEGKELFAGLLLGTEAAKHARRDRDGAGLLDTSHSHAKMPTAGRKVNRLLV